MKYISGGVTYKREMFASAPDNVLVLHISSEKPGMLSFDARLTREKFCENSGCIDDCSVYFDGVNGGKDGISFFAGMTGQVTDGTIKTIGEYIVVEKATTATLLISAATSFNTERPRESCLEILKRASAKGHRRLFASHIRDYHALFNRTHLNLMGEEVKLPTDLRLKKFREKQEDLGLIELYFHYGRYLLISSSRPGSLPANLQGIWCADYEPAWDSKYTNELLAG